MGEAKGFHLPKNKVRKLHALRIMGSSFGCLVGICLIAFLSAMSSFSFLIPSFGASCVILFVIPSSAYAQPRSLIGGHLISSLVGLICYLGLGTTWLSLSLAVGFAVAVMQVSRTLHPPAAADPLFFMMHGGSLSWQTVLLPTMAGSLVLVLFALIYIRWILNRPYPQYWI